MIGIPGHEESSGSILSPVEANEKPGLVRPEVGDKSLGWAWRPDGATTAALSRGRTKIKDARPPHGHAVSVAAAQRALAEMESPKRIRQHRRKDMAKKVSRKKTSVKKTPVKRAAKRERTEKVAAAGMIPLKKICQDLELDPKATRVKLRRLTRNGELDIKEIGEGRWEFTAAQAKQVRAALAQPTG